MGIEQTRAIFNKMRKVIGSNDRVRNVAILGRIKKIRGDRY